MLHEFFYLFLTEIILKNQISFVNSELLNSRPISVMKFLESPYFWNAKEDCKEKFLDEALDYNASNDYTLHRAMVL